MPHLVNSDHDGSIYWRVTCLCAAWCGTCNNYEATMKKVADQLASAYPGIAFAWVDIEDESDWLGDIDVDNFPTVMISRRGTGADESPHESLHFFGTVLPQPEQLARLVKNTIDKNEPLASPAADQQFAADRLGEFFKSA